MPLLRFQNTDQPVILTDPIDRLATLYFRQNVRTRTVLLRVIRTSCRIVFCFSFFYPRALYYYIISVKDSANLNGPAADGRILSIQKQS